jgi:hypothetical protein
VLLHTHRLWQKVRERERGKRSQKTRKRKKRKKKGRKNLLLVCKCIGYVTQVQAKFLHKQQVEVMYQKLVSWYKEEEEEEDSAKLKLYLKPMLGSVYP